MSEIALAPQGSFATAWAAWNGTGTAVITESFNVSSLTDNGTGDYTVTWRYAFATATYAVASTCRGTGTTTGEGGLTGFFATGDAITSAATRIYTSGAVNSKPTDVALASLVAAGRPHIPLSVNAEAPSSDDLIGFWCHWNASTAAIAEHFNVSSLTDNGLGDMTLTFVNALKSASYIASGVCRDYATASVGEALAENTTTAATASAVRTQTGSYNDGADDSTLNTMIGFTCG